MCATDSRKSKTWVKKWRQNQLMLHLIESLIIQVLKKLSVLVYDIYFSMKSYNFCRFLVQVQRIPATLFHFCWIPSWLKGVIYSESKIYKVLHLWLQSILHVIFKYSEVRYSQHSIWVRVLLVCTDTTCSINRRKWATNKIKIRFITLHAMSFADWDDKPNWIIGKIKY